MTSKSKRERTKPVSVRLTESEIARLQGEAGSDNLSLHIREKLLGGDQQRRRRTRNPNSIDTALAAILSRLGHLEIGSSLRKLAYAAEIGALPLDDDAAADLKSAASTLRQMRADLVHALGRPEGSP